MNRTILFFSILLFFINQSICQENELEYLIQYDLKFQPDSTNSKTNRLERMWLFSGNKGSLFLSKGQALKDSLAATANITMLGSDSWKEKTRATRTDFNFRIFKDRENGKLYHGEKIFKDKLFYTQPISSISWEIHPDSKEIFGYAAQKASTSFAGRTYTAWFSPEIPISDGPYKFSGLPGLILKLEDSDQEYVFSFVGFEKLSDPIITQIPPGDYQESDKKGLQELKKHFQKDPIKYVKNYIGAGGKSITLHVDEQQKKKLEKKREEQKNQNPIELVEE